MIFHALADILFRVYFLIGDVDPENTSAGPISHIWTKQRNNPDRIF